MGRTLTPFESATSRVQASRLRQLALNALSKYALRPAQLRFIRNGENCTFLLTDVKGAKYLIRVHRGRHHSPASIEEELAWLAHLAVLGFKVPRPVQSRSGAFLEWAEAPGVPSPKAVAVFAWLEGRSIEYATTQERMRNVGRLLAQLQLNPPPRPPSHRRYWDAAGLLGPNATFGGIDHLRGIRKSEQAAITRGRRLLLGKLRAFERRFPRRLGLIHADLHFGNILGREGQAVAAIDFDDCGHGFHAYDLVMPIISVYSRSAVHRANLRAALMEGYREFQRWDEHDDVILEHLIAARRLVMLGWLNARADNPNLKPHFAGALKRALRTLRESYGICVSN